MEIVFVLALMVVALLLFSSEAVSVDLVALGIIVALLLGGILEPAEALSGFANEAVVVLAGLFVLTAGLRVTGAVEMIGAGVARLSARSPKLAVPFLLAVALGVSAFINNTTCTALFLPVGLAVARSTRSSPSRVLMPLAFASILGGTLTVIGTSTNVIVRGLLPRYGLAPLAMFELAPVALAVAIAGLLYLVFFRRLLPERQAATVEQRFPVREYLTEVRVLERSTLVGRTVEQAALGRDWNLNLLALERAGETLIPQPHHVLESGDLLVVEGSVTAIEGLGRARGLEIEPRVEARASLAGEGDLHLVEAVILPRSELVGRSLTEAAFRQRYRANVIALKRHQEVLVQKLREVRLRVGDLLLVEGGPGLLARLASQKGLLVLDGRPQKRGTPRLALLAAAVLVAVVGLAVFGPFGLAGAVLAGCLVLLLTRCLTPAEAYAAVDWRLLVLIAGMMAYGVAMAKTGAATVLAELVVGLVGDLGPRGILAGFYLLTVMLTQPMSNQAAALVVFPVAMESAAALGLDPRAMAVTVALAASSSFLTPLEPSCLLVYNPGGYRFRDFPLLGSGLTLLAFLITVVLVPIFWPM